MSQPSYLVMALGVLNLLLAASGLLLSYFDWSAARRREFLYLHFTAERPGVSYFAMARRRRAQFTRLLAAFGILLVREVLAAIAYASVSPPHQWQLWTTWWHHERVETADPSIAVAAQLQPWLYCLAVLGIALLASGFLYRDTQEEQSTDDVVIVGFIAVWALFILLVVTGVFGVATWAVVRTAATIASLAIGAWVINDLLRNRSRDEQNAPTGLLPYEPMVLATAFAAWPVGLLLSHLLVNPVGGPLGNTLAYFPLVMMVARGVLSEYETVESSRHRMGRERQVIFSFLQRIGAAFTTAVEVEQVLQIILESALETTDASAGAIYLYQAKQGLLEPRVVLNFFPPLHVDTPAAMSEHRTEQLEEEMKHQSFQLGEGVIGAVAQSGQARIIDDVRAEGVMLGTTTDYMRNRSMLIVPLRIREEPLGVMAVLNKQRGSFGRDDQSLLQALADQGALSINNAMLTLEVRQQERLKRELQIARDIQQRLLPERCPVVPGFEIAARGTSATEVGGDYYDFFWVDDDRLGIVVADVSGKGVHAALVVAMIRSAFRAQARGNPDVRDVLTRVNDFISEDLRSDMFITCVYGVLEVSTRRFCWARAGHEPLLVAHSDAAVDLLSPDGFALGVIGSPDFGDALEVQNLELRSGDRILIFTDGLTEAMDSNGEEFGMERILQVMRDGSDLSHLNLSNGHSANGHDMERHMETHRDAGTATATVSTRPRSTAVNESEQDGSDLSNKSPGASGDAVDQPEDLKSIERAVQDHVGDAPQSDDLTIVYLAAK